MPAQRALWRRPRCTAPRRLPARPTGGRTWRLARPAIVNGVAGAIVGRPGRPFAVIAFTVVDDRIVELDFVVDPAKLARIDA